METKRNLAGDKVVDPNALANLQYNNASGAQKQINVGCKLHPLRDSGTTWTTDATTARALPRPGRSVAVFNKNAALQSITFGADATVTSLASGVVDNANGHVGLPCMPGDWSYFSAADYQFVISSSVDLLVYLIADDTYLENEIKDNS